MAFNLFGNEEKVLEEGLQLTLQLEAEGAPRALRNGVAALVDAYRKSTREQRRLVRFSDRLQEQLSAVNQELHRRREEAEQALQQLQEAQESLIQAEKLASLGSLVAGVAHEINTPVGIALASASHLSDTTREIRQVFEEGRIRKSDFQDYITTAVEASSLILANCQRAAELINGFKQVAVDRTTSEHRRFGLKDYIQETLRSLSPKLRQLQITTAIDCPNDLELDSYPGALSQILTNFVMNSVLHGFEDQNGGHINITAKQLDGDLIEISYTDNGKGMTPEVKNHVFDPFFTTKRGQGGNGLGLHIVFNIVTGSLKGQISVESEVGSGTRFSIVFPRITPRTSEQG